VASGDGITVPETAAGPLPQDRRFDGKRPQKGVNPVSRRVRSDLRTILFVDLMGGSIVDQSRITKYQA
jgi:hypothetical protein